jgi:hypothetical protein
VRGARARGPRRGGRAGGRPGGPGRGPPRARPDAALTAALADRADARGALVSYDLPVLGEPLADLEGAALVAAAGRHRVRLAVGVVVVGDLDDEGLAAAKERAGHAALEALLA